MQTFDTIYVRRSVRSFSETRIPDEYLSQIINAAIQAPSAKNRQPWFFYIINNEDVKKTFIETIRTGIMELDLKYKQNNINRPDIKEAQKSISSMEQAQAIILITHKKKYTQSFDDGVDWYLNAIDIEVTDILSLGAAIENMLLAATDAGYGSLWVCDIFYAYHRLKKFLQTDDAIISAICIGEANDVPHQSSRLPLEKVSKYITYVNRE